MTIFIELLKLLLIDLDFAEKFLSLLALTIGVALDNLAFAETRLKHTTDAARCLFGANVPVDSLDDHRVLRDVLVYELLAALKLEVAHLDAVLVQEVVGNHCVHANQQERDRGKFAVVKSHSECHLVERGEVPRGRDAEERSWLVDHGVGRNQNKKGEEGHCQKDNTS